MTERQDLLIKQLVEHYTLTAEPVASAYLSGKIKMSSATVRNDLVELEQNGFIEQPHTSSGRVPSLKGYRYYLQKHLKAIEPSKKIKIASAKAILQEQPVKSLAKTLAQQANNAILVAFDEDHFYYTGFSYLFSHPEFIEKQLIINIAGVIDHLDQVMATIYQQASNDVSVLIGDENPISDDTVLIASKIDHILLTILGPRRMNYNSNIGLLRHGAELLKNHKNA